MARLKSPKQKGDTYEREVAAYLSKNLGLMVSRAPLSGGGRSFMGAGSADLTGIPDFWVEAKRTERFRPYEALEQAERGVEAAKSIDTPIVVSRRNRMDVGQSLVVMRLEDFWPLLKAYLHYLGYVDDPSPQND